MSYYLNALKNYATFSGRARRSEYWYFFLFNVFFSIVVGVLAKTIELPALSSLYSLAVLLPGIAVGCRRLHDAGKSGWFLLIPIYNLILLCTVGVKGDNQYGADPKTGIAVG